MGAGAGGTDKCYVYYDPDKQDWYLYNSMNHGGIKANIIAVPGDRFEEAYYSKAIFTHRTTEANTVIPTADYQSHRADPYVTYIDNNLLNGNPDLILIITRVADRLSLYSPMDVHHAVVWYDPESEFTNPYESGPKPKGRWAIAYPARYKMEPGTCFNVMAMLPYQEAEEEMEYSFMSAFAFQEAVNPENRSKDNLNTAYLDDAKATELIHCLRELTDDRLPACITPEMRDSLEKEELIVVATERWEGPVYTKALLEKENPGISFDLLPEKEQGKLGTLRPVNTAPLSVWYVPDGFIWDGKAVAITDALAVFVAANETIKPIILNICTRLPCPTYCEG